MRTYHNSIAGAWTPSVSGRTFENRNPANHDEVIGLFTVTGFWVPGFNSRPLSDEDPDIAPDLVPLRERLMAIANRPVNIQAARDVVMYLRGELVGQPYLVLIDKETDE